MPGPPNYHQAVTRWLLEAGLNDHVHSGRPFVWWLLVFAGTCVAAALSYSLVERPCLHVDCPYGLVVRELHLRRTHLTEYRGSVKRRI